MKKRKREQNIKGKKKNQQKNKFCYENDNVCNIKMRADDYILIIIETTTTTTTIEKKDDKGEFFRGTMEE